MLVRELIVPARRNLAMLLCEAWFLAADQNDAENFQRLRKFVACVGGRIVGFVGVDGTYLSWLQVDPAHFGQGIGRGLPRLEADPGPGRQVETS